ncbi:hypothetical protein CHS0354_025324 [Potamilus streckersoni]|uniref:Uncharacterized protein n=1 Tax=Potamilus streckersoni TaxID=2493646 RepID=A0AAE0RUP4_9BIVA|nr:hypothetical protein CHS0354_025324 [Potamilus streckersoni]
MLLAITQPTRMLTSTPEKSGLPGTNKNVYKMSSTQPFFQKMALPSDSSSHEILHACNRLVTVDTSYKSGAQKTDSEMVDNLAKVDEVNESSADLAKMLAEAKDFLNSSRLDEAETAFMQLYQQMQEKPEDNGITLVHTLSGLADICIRRSRMCRSNPLEWQWLCMHAIALLQYNIEFCDSELENELDNQETEWFQEQRQSAELKCRPLEDNLVRALYNSLKNDGKFFDPFQSISLPNTPISNSRKSAGLFPLSSNVPQYLIVTGMHYRVTEQGLQKQNSDDIDTNVDWLGKFQEYCRGRLQTKNFTEVTGRVLKSTEGRHDDDNESVISNDSHHSLDWDHGDLQGIEEIDEEMLETDSPVKEYSFAFELASNHADNEGWDFFLNKRKNCIFQSVIQVSQTCHGEEEDPEMTKGDHDLRNERQRCREKEIISPLHEHSISLTLSRSFCKLADKLVQEEEYAKAEMVYEKILDVIDEIQDGTAGMLRFSARIMKNLGTVKSKQGKSSSGLAFLNKALQTYRDLQEEEANFEIAIALIELGNGYIVGKNNEDSVFEDVIAAICEFFEKDYTDTSTSTSSAGSNKSEMTSSLRSDIDERDVEEAIMCYNEAISLLDRYQEDEKQVEMTAKAIMRLGDCHFMQKNYDRALECFERSLSMFKTNNIFGKDSLMENAHVLCMLGVSSFMLHVYPRAASVFEMALHMVKCAYGYNRTFLHGLLLSLLGISQYKMKNCHKCVSMCYQAFEVFCDLFGEELAKLPKQKFWLVCQNLYVMGNSYNTLNLQQKGIKYLTIARSLMKASKCRERRQFMRVLQILGDCYFAQYDYKTALQFYNEALEYGECESQVSFDEVFDPNLASDEMTMHNHLVSKSAEAHISMQQYQNAVSYLEQAHDIQEVMGEDIKEDLINTLNQLGQMHSMAGDVEKAIGSYKESLEVYREIHDGKLGPEMCPTLGNLAAICYVKACISDQLDEELEMILTTEQYFQEALNLEMNQEVCVKYANFLYSQTNYEDAVMYLEDALKIDTTTTDIVYGGLEKVTLPDLLQDEVEAQDEICLPSTCLARYLLVLCNKCLRLERIAERHLIDLMEEVLDYDIPLLHSLLGYAMMELRLFEEASRCFMTAADMEEDYQLAKENCAICLVVLVQRTWCLAIEYLWDYGGLSEGRCLEY